MNRVLLGVAFGLALALALALVGCSPATQPTTTTAPTATGATGSSGLQLTTQDFQFTPAILDAKVGKQVTVTVQNTGAVNHNFSISSLQVSRVGCEYSNSLG